MAKRQRISARKWDLSHLDEKIEQVLGGFKNDLEEELSGVRSGPMSGGYGSFLPAYKNPQILSHSVAKSPTSTVTGAPRVLKDGSDRSTPVANKSVTRDVRPFLRPAFKIPQAPRPPKGPTFLPREEAKHPAKPVSTNAPRKVVEKVEKVAHKSLSGDVRTKLALPAQTHGVAKRPTSLRKEETTRPAKVVGTNAPRVRPNGSESVAAKVVEEKIQKSSLDLLLEDVRSGKKPLKLRIVFGSEKRKQKKTDVGEGDGPDVDQILSSVLPKSGPLVTPLDDSFLRLAPRNAKAKVPDSDRSSKKPPSGMDRKRKRIADVVKRINYSHCPAAYVRGKMPRLG